jgi:hypothetical protein
LAFSIRPESLLAGKINLASRAFAVESGRYRLAPLADGRVRLHLSSTHRLATHFNGYGGLWTDAIMDDIQRRILEVIKHRCETAATITAPPVGRPAIH